MFGYLVRYLERMRRALLVLLTGCSSILGIEDFKFGDAGGGSEMTTSGFCLGPTGWQICMPMEPTAAQNFDTPVSFSTTSNSRCEVMQPASWKAAQQPDACIVVGKTITVTADIPFTGDRPLVLFASDSITISMDVDVSSKSQISQRGAGSPGDACKVPGAATAASGGAGGSFIGKGGSGGVASVSGTVAGVAAEPDTARPTKLRGGCNGGVGANANGAQGGTAGRGGGAIYLVAGNRITINNAAINASGSLGGPAGQNAGGGGAGSGGMIVLFAPVISGENGTLVANGGGGGGGGGGNMAGVGGGEPVPTAPGNVARGGPGGGGGGTGGDGFAGGTAAKTGLNGSPTTACGGGGGGGGAGYIATSVTPTNLVISPPAQTMN
jgi:hypothetical protein